MIIKQCNHKWVHAESVHRLEYGIAPATFICEKCKVEMTAAEVFQLEALENQNKLTQHQLGFQKWLSILAFIVSITAILIALFK